LNLPLVAQVLAKKHQDGVAMRVIVDNDYSRSFIGLSAVEINQLDQRDLQKYEELVQLVDVNQDQELSPTEIAQRDALTILQQAGVKVIDDTQS
jgi:hypothetical protein